MSKRGPDNKNYHAVPSKSGWDVKQEGKSTPISSHRTQETAWKSAIRNAKSDEGEAFKHGRDGTIKKRNTYGEDYCPPSG